MKNGLVGVSILVRERKTVVNPRHRPSTVSVTNFDPRPTKSFETEKVEWSDEMTDYLLGCAVSGSWRPVVHRVCRSLLPADDGTRTEFTG